MRRFKKWLITKYLPAYAKEAAAENEEFLQKEIQRLRLENEKLKAYISGVEAGIKAQRKIVVNNGRGD